MDNIGVDIRITNVSGTSSFEIALFDWRNLTEVHAYHFSKTFKRTLEWLDIFAD